MLATVKDMTDAGVLGLNRRNAEFIMRLNPRRLYPRVDDKVLTKKLALEAGMAVPELYGLISSQSEVRSLPDIVESRESFVIKPAHGRRIRSHNPGIRRTCPGYLRIHCLHNPGIRGTCPGYPRRLCSHNPGIPGTSTGHLRTLRPRR